MIGCLFALVVLAVLALAVLLIPVGTALSFGQAAVVTALLGAVAWTARAAFRESGATALVLDLGPEERCFPALPEDGRGRVAVRLGGSEDGPTLAAHAPDVPPEPTGASDELPLLLTFERARPGARRGRLRIRRGDELLWEVPSARLGRRHELPGPVRVALRLPAAATPVALRFLDR